MAPLAGDILCYYSTGLVLGGIIFYGNLSPDPLPSEREGEIKLKRG